MRKFLNKGLWISLYLLFPITIVGLFSQNAIPGEFLYPVKHGMENVGMFVFALTPETKASYDSTLTERRFDEAQRLVVYNSSTSGLKTLVTQAAKTQESVQKVEDPKQKKILEEKLIQNINDYQEKLTQTQQKVDPTYIQPTPTPTSAIRITPTPPNRTRVQPTKIPLKVSAPVQRMPSATPTITPAPQPTVPQTPPDIIGDIEQTKKELEEIKKQVQSQSAQIQSTQTTQESNLTPTISTVMPTHSPSSIIYSNPTSPPTFAPSPHISPLPSGAYERQDLGDHESQYQTPDH